MKKYINILIILYSFTIVQQINAQDAPVIQAGIISHPGPVTNVSVTVSNFNDIGAVSLTLHYDPSIALATTVTPIPALEDNFVYCVTTPGVVVISWISLSGISLASGSEAFIISFSKVNSGTTSLSWYDNGISCEYAKYDNGNYTVLNDNPTSVFYQSGELTFLFPSPVTALPSISACANDIVHVPVTVNDFENIGAISLTLDYNPDVLEFQGFTTSNILPTNFTVEAVVPGRVKASGYLTDPGPGISLPDFTVLFIMDFHYMGGNSNLTWYDDGTSCEYANSPPPDFVPTNDLPQSLYYYNGSVGELERPSVLVSGSTTINKGESAEIIFNMTGTPPWNLTYTDRFNSIIINDIQTNPYLVNVAPLQTTTYTALAINDQNCNGLASGISGSAIITVNEYPIDIILQKTSNCSELSVLLKPSTDVNQHLTKVIFTVSWPANTGSDVQLSDAAPSWPGLVQVGSRILHSGKYYLTFSSSTQYEINWPANSENNILTFRMNGTGEGTTDFEIIANDYDQVPPGLNTAYYIEVNDIDATGSILNNANGASLNCAVYLKDFLQGSYLSTTHMMRTDLNINGVLPLSQPYASTQLAYTGLESVSAFTSEVVDWVVVELRTGIAANTSLERQAALLLSNGSIVSTDQENPPVFRSIIPGNTYFIVIYHRNHFPVMSLQDITLPNTPLTMHDFTSSPANNVYGATNGVIPLESGIYGQIAGDINQDNKLIFSSLHNDRGLILGRIGSLVNPVFLNSTVNGYYEEDLNMNSQVKYSGSGNDAGIIHSNIDFFTEPTYLNSIFIGSVPVTWAP